MAYLSTIRPPFETPARPDLPDYLITAVDAFKMWYRVKAWTLSWSYTYNWQTTTVSTAGGYTEVNTYEASGGGSVDLENNFTGVTEDEFACITAAPHFIFLPSPIHWESERDRVYDDPLIPPENATSDGDDSFFLQFGFEPPNVGGVIGKIYPTIYIEIMGVKLEPDDLADAVTFPLLLGPFPSYVAWQPKSKQGDVIPSPGSTLTWDLDEMILSINITPLEYWPYDPGDGGGPAYDTVTGDPIRDVFSIQLS